MAVLERFWLLIILYLANWVAMSIFFTTHDATEYEFCGQLFGWKPSMRSYGF
jgi:hypothetical protein